jgi:hypothetical protein
MFGFSAERPVFSWLLSRLGPPPPPPRRHFSKSWDGDAQHRVASRLGRPGRGAGTYASGAGEAFAADVDGLDATGSNGPSGT